MKVAIMYSPKPPKLESIAKLLGQAFSAGGHSVDYVQIAKTDRPVNVNRYDLVCLGSVSEGSFGGKIPLEVSEFIKQCRGIQNVKSAAFLLKRGIGFNDKGLRRLMGILESEGSLVMDFQLIAGQHDTEALAKRLKDLK